MKKFTVAIFSLLVAFTGISQKIFSTKSAAVNFSASGGMEEIEAINSEVDCKLVDRTGQMVFTLLIKGFRFENQLMENHFNEDYMESTKYPKAGFKGYISNIATINLAQDGAYKAEVDGTLNIHGTNQKIKVTGTINVAADKITMKSNFKIKLKDYKISGSYIGDKIAAEATITVNCKF